MGVSQPDLWHTAVLSPLTEIRRFDFSYLKLREGQFVPLGGYAIAEQFQAGGTASSKGCGGEHAWGSERGGALAGAPERGCWLGPKGPACYSKGERQDPTKMRNSQISFPPSPLGSKWSDQEQRLILKWEGFTLISFFLKPHHNGPHNKHNSWFLDPTQVLLCNNVLPAVNWTVLCNNPSHLSVPSNE